VTVTITTETNACMFRFFVDVIKLLKFGIIREALLMPMGHLVKWINSGVNSGVNTGLNT